MVQGRSRPALTWPPGSLTKAFARIHWQNLVNFGIPPLTFEDESEYDKIEPEDVLKLERVHQQLREGRQLQVENVTRKRQFLARHDLLDRQIEVLLRGGLINWMRSRLA